MRLTLPSPNSRDSDAISVDFRGFIRDFDDDTRFRINWDLKSHLTSLFFDLIHKQ
ncbi:hypothetical protein KFK09_015367 [Dendrobium nobile]|uniref:Uncharacterized protein n=1 Tax=Dendrobium nobile TaxID=94219 RepID=A0A8T3B5Y5_DENNO|nr:hypothetical protein KFK09_015367 [Dendrobium nobile]